MAQGTFHHPAHSVFDRYVGWDKKNLAAAALDRPGRLLAIFLVSVRNNNGGTCLDQGNRCRLANPHGSSCDYSYFTLKTHQPILSNHCKGGHKATEPGSAWEP
jgi:hypothetical protein